MESTLKGRMGRRQMLLAGWLCAALVLSPMVPTAFTPGASAADDSPCFVDNNSFSGFMDWISDGRGTSISRDGFGRTTATWSDGNNKLKVKIEGEVEFGDDDRTISRLSKGGYFAIWEKRGSQKTELAVTAGRDGNLEYEYNVNGKEVPFESGGSAWLAEVLIDIIRKTGIGAEERANRLLDRGGVDALLEDVRFVENDFVIRVYLGEALARRDLTTSDCASILDEAAMSMESDYEKAELLLTVAKHQSWNSTLAAGYAGVAETMESDYEIRRALSAITLDETPGPEVINLILRIAARMDSDYETAELLVAFAPRCQGSQQLSRMYVDAAADIESDYEARRALSALDWRDDPLPETVVGALTLAARLESDYDAAELLIELAPVSHTDERAAAAFMRALGEIASDYDAARSLASFASAEQLDESAVLAALGAAGGISSSYDRSGALSKLGRHCHDSQTLEDAYMDAVDAVDAEYERNQLYVEFYGSEREARRARRGN